MLRQTMTTEAISEQSSLMSTVESSLTPASSGTSAKEQDLETVHLAVARMRLRRKGFRRRGLLPVVVLLLLAIVTLVSGIALILPMPLAGGISIVSSIASGLMSVLIMLWLNRMSLKEKEAIQRLVGTEDPHRCGDLIDMLMIRLSTPIVHSLYNALDRLLPMLTEEEVLALGDERHFYLASNILAWDVPVNRYLYAPVGDTYLLTLLKLFGVLGRESFRQAPMGLSVTYSLMPTLNRWVSGKGAGKSVAVQKAALLCQEKIREHQELARSGKELLRGSSAQRANESEHLLRAASFSDSSAPSELVRGADKPEEEGKEG